MNDLHPSIAHFRPLFRYKQLPPDLQKISKPFADLANDIMERSRAGSNPEHAAALRKLLEAKDCAVRAEGFAKWKADADGA